MLLRNAVYGLMVVMIALSKMVILMFAKIKMLIVQILKRRSVKSRERNLQSEKINSILQDVRLGSTAAILAILRSLVSSMINFSIAHKTTAKVHQLLGALITTHKMNASNGLMDTTLVRSSIQINLCGIAQTDQTEKFGKILTAESQELQKKNLDQLTIVGMEQLT